MKSIKTLSQFLDGLEKLTLRLRSGETDLSPEDEHLIKLRNGLEKEWFLESMAKILEEFDTEYRNKLQVLV